MYVHISINIVLVSIPVISQAFIVENFYEVLHKNRLKCLFMTVINFNEQFPL